MRDQSSSSQDPTLPGFDNSTLSPESAAGPSLFVLPDGPKTVKSGLGAAPASLSARPGKEAGSKTKGISGPISFGSSPSAVLQQSLENRLRARLDVNGSLEYDLTWKHWDTESDAPICALRASARRISVNVSIGWPIEGWPKTPMASDGEGGVMEIRPGTLGKYKLRDFAQLAGWATAQASDPVEGARTHPDSNQKCLGRDIRTFLLAAYPTPNVPNGGRCPAGGMSPTGITPTGKKRQVGTEQIALLCGWATPRATDGTNGGPMQEGALSGDAALAGWPTTLRQNGEKAGMPPETRKGHTVNLQDAVLGVITGLFFVPTGKRVVLAPEFSLWLMGFPEEWQEAAPNYASWLERQAALELEYLKEAGMQ